MKQRLEVGVDGASGTQAVQSNDSSAMELLVGGAAACVLCSLFQVHQQFSFPVTPSPLILIYALISCVVDVLCPA
jgi:hypothetical protein